MEYSVSTQLFISQANQLHVSAKLEPSSDRLLKRKGKIHRCMGLRSDTEQYIM